jgi:hypothetical protein
VAEYGPRPAREHGGHRHRQRLDAPVAQRVDAGVHANEPSFTAPALDPGMTDANRQKLSSGDMPVLPGGDDRDLYRGVISISHTR